jgi:hypothetical protein
MKAELSGIHYFHFSNEQKSKEKGCILKNCLREVETKNSTL